MAEAAPILMAKSISLSRCEHGSVFVHLHGEDGDVFATASMDIETAVEFNMQLLDQCEAILDARAKGDLEPAPELH